MAITTGKREREKLKQQKRLEKQKKKDERQSKGSDSFEDMIAYVDENGQLSSTPPDRPSAKIDASQIEISVPKLVAEEVEPENGIVDFYNSSKGFGFIKTSDNRNKYFFHISSAPENIKEGDKVSYELEKNARGINAVRISIINK